MDKGARTSAIGSKFPAASKPSKEVAELKVINRSSNKLKSAQVMISKAAGKQDGAGECLPFSVLNVHTMGRDRIGCGRYVERVMTRVIRSMFVNQVYELYAVAIIVSQLGRTSDDRKKGAGNSHIWRGGANKKGHRL